MLCWKSFYLPTQIYHKSAHQLLSSSDFVTSMFQIFSLPQKNFWYKMQISEITVMVMHTIACACIYHSFTVHHITDLLIWTLLCIWCHMFQTFIVKLQCYNYSLKVHDYKIAHTSKHYSNWHDPLKTQLIELLFLCLLSELPGQCYSNRPGNWGFISLLLVRLPKLPVPSE